MQRANRDQAVARGGVNSTKAVQIHASVLRPRLLAIKVVDRRASSAGETSQPSMSSSPGSEPAAGIADLLLWPWRVGRALALLPISFQLQEGPSRTATSQGSTPEALRPLHNKLRAALQPKEYVLVVPRALHSWQAGQQVFSHALAYNAVEAGVKLLHLQPAAERLLGASHALLRGAAGTAHKQTCNWLLTRGLQ